MTYEREEQFLWQSGEVERCRRSKKSWLTFYGLSDHDFPIKWMFRLSRSEGFSGWFPISPSSALRAPSPSREKVLLRFLKQWILQLRVNPSCRMTWGWGESGRRNSSLKYAAINGMIRTASVQHSTNESIKNQCWWHQSTNNERSHSNYCEQHQYQCAEHQQPMCSASADNAHSTRLPNAWFL